MEFSWQQSTATQDHGRKISGLISPLENFCAQLYRSTNIVQFANRIVRAYYLDNHSTASSCFLQQPIPDRRNQD
jgi:hypothetical protein